MNNFLPIQDMPRRPTIGEITDLRYPSGLLSTFHLQIRCTAAMPPFPGPTVGLDKGLVLFVCLTEGWKPEI